MVVLEKEEVFASQLVNALTGRLLGMHRIGGPHAILHIHWREQLFDGTDLVFFLRHAALGKHEAASYLIDREHMHARLARRLMSQRASHRFASLWRRVVSPVGLLARSVGSVRSHSAGRLPSA